MDWFCECEGAEVPPSERGLDRWGGRLHLAPGGAHTLRCETDGVLRSEEFNSEARGRWTQQSRELTP